MCLQSSSDSDHCIRCAFGNGLRRDVWKVMSDRFKIPHIYEFYAATEMPVGMVNISNKLGAVGRMSPLLVRLQSNRFILKVVWNTNILWRAFYRNKQWNWVWFLLSKLCFITRVSLANQYVMSSNPAWPLKFIYPSPKNLKKHFGANIVKFKTSKPEKEFWL